MYNTATWENYEVTNIYTMGVPFFAKGPYQFMWACSKRRSKATH
jgi:hypothetical protein